MCGLLARLHEAGELAGQRGFDGDVQQLLDPFSHDQFYVGAKARYAVEGTAYPSHFPKTPGKPDLEVAYISEDSSLVNEFVARGVLNLCYRLGVRGSERPPRPAFVRPGSRRRGETLARRFRIVGDVNGQCSGRSLANEHAARKSC